MQEIFNSDYSLFYLVCFLISVLLSIMINGLFVKFSKTLGIRNAEDITIVRWASTSKPAFGGISFFILFLFSMAVFAIFNNGAILINKKYFALLLSCTVGFLIGLADDAYNTKPILKFSGQLLCAIIFLGAEIYINATPLRMINYFITILWVVGIMNSINMLDNMDGIVTTISIVIVAAIVAFMAINGTHDTFFYITSFGVIAALIGFLVYNWHPSKMYMGDTGSQFLGAFLAGLSILFIWNVKQESSTIIQIRQFILPLIIFLVPLLDTITVSIRRISKGNSPFVGGKDHITHQLAFLGVKDNWVTAVYLFISIISSSFFIYLDYIKLETKYFNPLAIGYTLALFILIQLMYQYNIAKNNHVAKKATPKASSK
jgi:UDP-GlcNAc:undecaprenyl-phosphate GlcNAc-1-phosphate transferase